MQLNVLNDLAKANRRGTEKKQRAGLRPEREKAGLLLLGPGKPIEGEPMCTCPPLPGLLFP